MTSYQSQSVCFFSVLSVCCLLPNLSISPRLYAALLRPRAPRPVTSERLLLRRRMQLQIRAKTQVEAAPSATPASSEYVSERGEGHRRKVLRVNQ